MFPAVWQQTFLFLTKKPCPEEQNQLARISLAGLLSIHRDICVSGIRFHCAQREIYKKMVFTVPDVLRLYVNS